jgi:hypothetical protein
MNKMSLIMKLFKKKEKKELLEVNFILGKRKGVCG